MKKEKKGKYIAGIKRLRNWLNEEIRLVKAIENWNYEKGGEVREIVALEEQLLKFLDKKDRVRKMPVDILRKGFYNIKRRFDKLYQTYQQRVCVLSYDHGTFVNNYNNLKTIHDRLWIKHNEVMDENAALKHIKHCKKHPLTAARKEIKRLKNEIKKQQRSLTHARKLRD